MFRDSTLHHLYQYLDHIIAQHKELYVKDNPSTTEVQLGALCALQEEVGELTQEVRRHTQMLFSHSKAALADKEKILSEACDVLICTLLLMKEFGGDRDYSEILASKIAINQERGY